MDLGLLGTRNLVVGVFSRKTRALDPVCIGHCSVFIASVMRSFGIICGFSFKCPISRQGVRVEKETHH